MERRRRKGLPETAMNGEDLKPQLENYNRQKRHSWWNIFVPDNLKNR